MIITILSLFNNRIGPVVFLKMPNNSPPVEKIPLLMDLFKNGFFIHEDSSMKSANIIFNIYSPTSRGKSEQLMLSVVSINENYNINLNTFKEVMEFFVERFQNIEQPYEAIYSDNSELIELLSSFYQALPDDRAISKNLMSQMLTYGLSQTGKNTILKTLQEKFAKVVRPLVDPSIERSLRFPL